jgi:cytochrome c oxidase subunit 2
MEQRETQQARIRLKKSRLLLLTAVMGVLCFMTGASYPQGEEPRVIQITARRFAFTPTQITLKKGETIKLQLTSEDVTHGFFMPEPRISEVITAGEIKEVTVTPERLGMFTASCSRVCGIDHANMQMIIVVE